MRRLLLAILIAGLMPCNSFAQVTACVPGTGQFACNRGGAAMYRSAPNAPVSAVGQGGFRYNDLTQEFEQSISGGAWASFGGGGGGSGDIEGVTAGAGLTGGGLSGSVTLSIPTGGIVHGMVLDGTLTSLDLSGTAGILGSQLSPTAGITVGQTTGIPSNAGVGATGTWPISITGTAPALAANGSNCAAGQYPLGVDTAGNSENCTVANLGTVTSVTAVAPLASTGGADPQVSITGIVGVPNGGTGVATLPLNSVLLGNNGSPVAAVVNGAVGQILTSTGTGTAPTFQSPVGIVLSVQTFTASGTYTPTAGTLFAGATLCGGGGAAGGRPATGAATSAAASGGGGGGCLKALLTAAQIGASQTVTIGAGGAAAAIGGTGGTGGTTTFGALLSATGGSGGSPTAVTAGTSVAAGGVGGVPTVSTGTAIKMVTGEQGGPGEVVSNLIGMSGKGGNALDAFGGQFSMAAPASVVAGNSGLGAGAGSSGSVAVAVVSAGAVSLAGQAGSVVIFEYR